MYVYSKDKGSVFDGGYFRLFINFNFNSWFQISNCSADVYFVLQETVEPFHLINNTRQDELFPGGDLGDLKNKIGGDPSLEVIAIRKPFDSEASRIFQLSKSYVWWLDDPWAALVALAAISILLCLVGLIVIIFTHSRSVVLCRDTTLCSHRENWLKGTPSHLYTCILQIVKLFFFFLIRYMRYVREYETHLRAFDQPEFVEPPSFLREYETQVKHLQYKFYIFFRM